jgi:hypothetical protein
MSELRPCPFCGGEMTGQPDLFSGGTRYDHHCISDLLGEHDLRALWNTRVIEDALRSKIAELEARILPDEVLDEIVNCLTCRVDQDDVHAVLSEIRKARGI